MLTRMRIGLLVDGLHDRETIERLAKLTALGGAELLLVYVHGAGPRGGLEMVRHRPGGRGLPRHREHQLAEAERSRGTEALADAARHAATLGVTARTFELTGEPGKEVCELAARERMDLFVVRAGGRDAPPVGPRSVGPAARFITDHSPCPVLVIRGDA